MLGVLLNRSRKEDAGSDIKASVAGPSFLLH